MSLRDKAFKHAAEAAPAKKFAEKAKEVRNKLIREVGDFSGELRGLKITGFKTNNEDGAQDNHSSTDFVNLAISREGSKGKSIATVRMSKTEDKIQIDNLDADDRVYVKQREFTYGDYEALTDALSAVMVADIAEADIEALANARAKQTGPDAYGPKAPGE